MLKKYDKAEKILIMNKFRNDKKINQSALAGFLGKTLNTISAWETGRREIPDEIIACIEHSQNLDFEVEVSGRGRPLKKLTEVQHTA